MKKILRIGIVLLGFTQLKAQSIPTSPAATVSYDLEETSYKQLPANANVDLLTDNEKLSFKSRVVRKHVDNYLNAQNETTTVITFINQDGFDNVSANPVVKIVMDKNGLFGYSATNALLFSEPASAQMIASSNALTSNITKDKFLAIPDFTVPAQTDIDQARAQGVTVRTEPNLVSVKSGNIELLHDNTHKLLETKTYSGATVVGDIQSYYTVDARGQKVPTVKIEKNFDTSANGLQVQDITIERYSNYTRIIR